MTEDETRLVVGLTLFFDEIRLQLWRTTARRFAEIALSVQASAQRRGVALSSVPPPPALPTPTPPTTTPPTPPPPQPATVRIKTR